MFNIRMPGKWGLTRFLVYFYRHLTNYSNFNFAISLIIFYFSGFLYASFSKSVTGIGFEK